jgi:putative Holliday junction resolvase
VSGAPGKILAFDLGSKRIGVAAGDEAHGMAFPLVTLPVTSRAATLDRIMELVLEHRPAALVVGLPLNMNGSRGPAAARCEEFALRLGAASGLPVHLEDERLTTAWAERSLVEQNLRRNRRREVIDQAAAVLLLQGWLERRRSSEP